MIFGTPADRAYAQRLQRLARRGGWLRRWIDPQHLYGRHLRSLNPGFILDIGCGIGRSLGHVKGHGVGVDTNAACIQVARDAGFEAYVPDDFSAPPGSFDSLLFAHVLEHLEWPQASDLVGVYLPFVRVGGQVIIISPQPRGQRSDPTHRQLVDRNVIRRIAEMHHLRLVRMRSFPLPRMFGRVFTYNETVAVLRTNSR